MNLSKNYARTKWENTELDKHFLCLLKEDNVKYSIKVNQLN